MTCLPTGTVEWLMRKFDVHSKLNGEEVTITLNGKNIDGDEKEKIINDFNAAIFIEKQYIFPGTEEHFLHPENSKPPIVIETKNGKHPVTLHVFRYDDHIDVVKQYKKKVAAYSLDSKGLQKWSLTGPKAVL